MLYTILMYTPTDIHTPTLGTKGPQTPNNFYISNFNIFTNWHSPIVGMIYTILIHIFNWQTFPTQTPSNLYMYPNCWHDIYNTNTYTQLNNISQLLEIYHFWHPCTKGPNCPGPNLPLFRGGQLGPGAQLSGAQFQYNVGDVAHCMLKGASVIYDCCFSNLDGSFQFLDRQF